jgi:hypothetical protein
MIITKQRLSKKPARTSLRRASSLLPPSLSHQCPGRRRNSSMPHRTILSFRRTITITPHSTRDALLASHDVSLRQMRSSPSLLTQMRRYHQDDPTAKIKAGLSRTSTLRSLRFLFCRQSVSSCKPLPAHAARPSQLSPLHNRRARQWTTVCLRVVAHRSGERSPSPKVTWIGTSGMWRSWRWNLTEVSSSVPRGQGVQR